MNAWLYWARLLSVQCAVIVPLVRVVKKAVVVAAEPGLKPVAVQPLNTPGPPLGLKLQVTTAPTAIVAPLAGVQVTIGGGTCALARRTPAAPTSATATAAATSQWSRVCRRAGRPFGPVACLFVFTLSNPAQRLS